MTISARPRTICGGGRFCWRLSNRSMWGGSAFIRNRSNAKIRGRSSPRPVRVSRSALGGFWLVRTAGNTLRWRCARRIFPEMPIPLRLPFGAWWLAEKSAMDHELMYGEFESMEMGFVQRLLRPGMTVLDVGAHHGLYTLLLSKRVGVNGRVIAFEPSPRECRRLEKHLRFNRYSNAHVEHSAAGSEAGEADLYLVDGFQDWCNSLRPPALPDPTSTVRVRVRRIDDVLAEQ